MSQGVGDVGVCSCRCNSSSCVDASSSKPTKQFSVQKDGKGNTVFNIVDSKSGKLSNFSLSDVPGVVGDVSCAGCSVQIVRSTNSGFSGLTDAGDNYFAALFTNTSTATKRRLLQSSSTTGVATPMMCIKAGSGVLFEVTRDSSGWHYPVYDRDSLINTNPNFDFGSFLTIRSRIDSGQDMRAFFFTFSSPGIYAFMDSASAAKKTVVGVVDPVIECPSAFQTNALQPLSAQLLKQFPNVRVADEAVTLAPDYGLVIGLSVGLVGLILIAIGALFFMRRRGLNASSKISHKIDTTSVEELHRFLGDKGVGNVNAARTSSNVDNVVDLEGFSVETLYDKLQDQTNLVTEQLTQQKHDVRDFYEKVSRETMELKSMVMQQLQAAASQANVAAGAPAMSVSGASAEQRRVLIQEEIERRRVIARSMLKNVESELDILAEDMKETMAFREVEEKLRTTLLSEVTDVALTFRDFRLGNKKQQTAVSDRLKQIASNCKAARDAIANESARRQVGDFSIIGGGVLVKPGAREAIDLSELLDDDGQPREIAGLTKVDSLTKLIVPKSSAKMQVGEDVVIPVPPMSCVMPNNGRIVPIEGHTFVDKENGGIAFGSELEIDDIPLMLPYVHNPKLHSGEYYPVPNQQFSHLFILKDYSLPLRKTTMLDPSSGLEVPILAATYHPREGVVPVGGAMIDPITRQLTPIVLGEPMEDPETGQIVPVMGVIIDPSTGAVKPIGGTTIVSGSSDRVVLVRGRRTIDLYSGESIKVGAAVLNATTSKVVGITDDLVHSGEDREMSSTLRVVQAVEELRDEMFNFVEVLLKLQKVIRAVSISDIVRRKQIVWMK